MKSSKREFRILRSVGGMHRIEWRWLNPRWWHRVLHLRPGWRRLTDHCYLYLCEDEIARQIAWDNGTYWTVVE